jgi:hypothetical protein
MRQIENITDEPHQRHTIVFEESEIALELRFLPVVEMWFVNVEYKGVVASGYKLSADVLHMRSRNFPFDFTVLDLSNSGIDPFRIDDFSSGRCGLYLVESADMEAIRGAPVPL